ncbi:Na+/H+ antiporter subunit A [Cytobacillus purgationiresistens]|uniref:Multicomponent Na+:H+ antiporter subunit A n=1 Tax=Cytobacillus purgationiresistens TaxID=863449 RepID=A0ABU0AF46_9BACI|nr:Na+/H+ antiporter subunit A [Cytobacillus purgationiresistens]MDQ0269882.1 multicomponent Na+:H+ antiporter subunit A [Cytobacillus purgationiresistens]
MSLLHIMILIPFIFAIFVPLLYKFFNPRIHTGWFVLIIPVIIFIYLIRFIPGISSGETMYHSMAWMPSFGINFDAYVDGLGLVFGLLITGIGALVILYSIYYMSKEREALHNFYVYLLMFMGAMLGVVFSDNILVLYVFWELTSISSFLLIAYWYQREKSRYGAQKSMLITIFGGLAMLSGFIMLSMMTDTYSIREMFTQINVITEHHLFLPAMILILLGAFTKSAQFPFSIWLPDAMEAPTPISAYLHSATMVKAGIYLVARMTPIFGGSSEWFWLVSGIGLITLLYGSINAVRQTDLKGLLAYSTISQLGLIMSLLGIGSAALYFGYGREADLYVVAITASIFHMINHSTFKGSLFMVVGIIDHETGTRDIRRLGGLMTIMPISFTIAVIGSFAMAGLPPFNGFISKEMFFTSVLEASKLTEFNMETFGILFPVIAWVASVFTFIYSMILVFKTFRGKYKPEKLEKKAHEAPIGMLISPIILASLVVIIFFFPNIIADYLLKPAVASVLPSLAEGGIIDMKISAWHGWNTELFMTIGVVVLGGLMYMYLKKWVGIYRLYPQNMTLNQLYNSGLDHAQGWSKSLTDGYMTGYIRDYIAYLFGFFILFIGGTLLVTQSITLDFSNNAPVNVFEGALVLAMMTAAVTVLFAKTRLTAIIALGVLGYLVSMFFVIFRAPDLALTQLVVETVTTALFLLCFYHLPKFKEHTKRVPLKPLNLVISIGVGIIVTLFAFSANGTRLFDPIASYYEDAYELAGAKNIVNSILVDFRGIDTMLEIFVLCIAGLGVYTMIKLGLDRREK